MGPIPKPNLHAMSSPLALPQDEYFLHEVAKLADQGLAFQQMMQIHEEALDAESVLFDGVDAQHASDCRLKADEVRSKKRLHSELTSALDDFVQGARRLKQAHLRSHVNRVCSLVTATRKTSSDVPKPRWITFSIQSSWILSYLHDLDRKTSIGIHVWWAEP